MSISSVVNAGWLNPVLDDLGLSYASNLEKIQATRVNRMAIKIIINMSIAIAATVAIGLIIPLPFSAIVLLSVVAGVAAANMVEEDPATQICKEVGKEIFSCVKKLFSN